MQITREGTELTIKCNDLEGFALLVYAHQSMINTDTFELAKITAIMAAMVGPEAHMKKMKENAEANGTEIDFDSPGIKISMALSGALHGLFNEDMDGGNPNPSSRWN